MNIKLPCLLLGAGLLASVPAHAHDLLLFSTSVRTLTVQDTTNSVTLEVKWEVDKPAASNLPAAYKLTITATKGSLMGRTYSLWTLGVQNADFDVKVTQPASGVDLLNPDEKTPVANNIVPATGKKFSTQNKRYMPFEQMICFAKFSGPGPYVLRLEEAGRVGCGLSTWDNGAQGNGHDNTPPPSDPN